MNAIESEHSDSRINESVRARSWNCVQHLPQNPPRSANRVAIMNAHASMTTEPGAALVRHRIGVKCIKKGSDAPAYMPVYLNPPVAALIAPEIGGPATAPSASRVELIPIRTPTSCVFPIRTMGAARSEMYTPDDALESPGKYICRAEIGGWYVPVNDGDSNVPADARGERPDVGHDASDDRCGRHHVERTRAVSRKAADDTADGRAGVRNGEEVE